MNRSVPALAAAFVIALAAAPAHGHGRLINFTIDLGGSIPVGDTGLKETTFEQYPYWADACNVENDPRYDDPGLSPGPGYNGYIAICNPVSGGFNYSISMDLNLPFPIGLGVGYASSIFARYEDPLYRPEEGGGPNRGEKNPYIAHFIFFQVKLRLLDMARKKYKMKWGSLDLDVAKIGYGSLYGGHGFIQLSYGLSYMYPFGRTFQMGVYFAMNHLFALDKRRTVGQIPWGPTEDDRTGYITAFEGDKNEMWMSFGMRMAIGFADWGKKKKEPGEVIESDSEYAEQMKLMDQDGDGLSDYSEMMLGTDSTKRDTDGDTIPDGIEDANVNGIRDPGETNPAMFDTDVGGVNDGWELSNGYDPLNPDDDDRDLDGVLDDKDVCPGTPSGSEVGAAGCPTLTESVILDQVTFVEGTAELNPEAYTQLDQYAMILLQDPELEIVILVFGPPSGNKNKIKKNTEAQAEAIKDYLVMRGLDEARIVVSGEGKAPDGPKVELQPIIPLF